MKNFLDAIAYYRGPPIMLTPSALTTKAKQIKSIEKVNMNPI